MCCIRCEDPCESNKRHGGECRVRAGECVGCPAAVQIENDEQDEIAELNAVDHNFRAGEPARMGD